ncbi:MAG: Ig-like domain-containing protein, partial [Thermodesulfobacteriota bacterium]
RNQLVKADNGDGTTVDFTYDALNRRVEKKVTGISGPPVISRYIWSGWQTIEERDGTTDQLLSRYTYGNGIDEPVEIEKHDPDTGQLKRFIPMQDTNGSVLGLADERGNLVERVKYTPYGNPTFIYDHEPPEVDQVRVVNNALRIRFSEPIKQDSAQGAITVKQGATVLTGSLALLEEDRLVTFSPSGGFPQGQMLTVEITTDVEDLSGNHLAEDFTQTFTPTGVNLLIYDRGPPNVERITLVAGKIRVDFDEELDPASIANGVELSAIQNEVPTIVGLTIAAQGEKALEATPSTTLTDATHYIVKIKTTITDLSGKPVAAEIEKHFIYRHHDALLYELPAEDEHARSSVGNTTTFQARDYDHQTGTIDFRRRVLSPELGRFLQPDPMGYADSMSLYQGFGNNPANFLDPMGLDVWTRVFGALKALGGLAEGAGGAALVMGGGISEGATLGASTPVSVPAVVFGGLLFGHGADTTSTGLVELFTGNPSQSITSKILTATTGSRELADNTEVGLGIVGGAIGACGPGRSTVRATRGTAIEEPVLVDRSHRASFENWGSECVSDGIRMQEQPFQGSSRMSIPGDVDYTGPLPTGSWRLSPKGQGAHLIERVNVEGRPSLLALDQAGTPRFYPHGSPENAGQAHIRLHLATRSVGIKLQGGNPGMSDLELIKLYERAFCDPSLNGIRGSLRTPDAKVVVSPDTTPPDALRLLLEWFRKL